MSKKVIYLPEIGEITLQKRKQSKDIKLRINSRGIVSVSLPIRASFKEAENFVREKKDWIKDNLKIVNAGKKEPDFILPEMNLKTRKHYLQFSPHKLENIRVKIDKGIINFCYPVNTDLKKDSIQKYIKKGIDKALKIEAEEYLPERLEFLSKKTGLQYRNLKLVNVRRYWGMCMTDDVIKLNIQLMKLPDDCIDYIILHELAHTKERNHSQRFYGFLGTLIPDPKGWRRKLKKYNPDKYVSEVKTLL